MVCKNGCLLVVNFIFIVMASVLIGFSSYAKDANIAIIYHHCQYLPIFGGIIAFGVFLLFVAVLGLLATFKQSQALMSIYIIILGILCVLQFFTSIASLLVKHETKSELIFNSRMVLSQTWLLLMMVPHSTILIKMALPLLLPMILPHSPSQMLS